MPSSAGAKPARCVTAVWNRAKVACFFPRRPVDGLLQPVLLHFGVVLFGLSLVGIRSEAASFGPVQDTLVGSTPL